MYATLISKKYFKLNNNDKNVDLNIVNNAHILQDGAI
jgi:hypothetical protein